MATTGISIQHNTIIDSLSTCPRQRPPLKKSQSDLEGTGLVPGAVSLTRASNLVWKTSTSILIGAQAIYSIRIVSLEDKLSDAPTRSNKTKINYHFHLSRSDRKTIAKLEYTVRTLAQFNGNYEPPRSTRLTIQIGNGSRQLRQHS